MKDISQFRTDAPVTSEQYQEIDDAVQIAARQSMVGRKIMPIYGPLGFGVQEIGWDELSEVSDAQADMGWKVDASEDIVDLSRSTKGVPVLRKGFRINRRSLASSQRQGTPLDVSSAKSAAYKVALLEDEMILIGLDTNGDGNYEVNGFREAAGNNSGGSDWGTGSQIETSVINSMDALMTNDIYPPYHLIVNPQQYNEAQALIGNTAKSYLSWIKDNIKGNVYVTNTLADGVGLMVAAGDRGFFDLALGTDITTEVEETSLLKGKDLFGLVYECAVPRVIDANAIDKLDSI